MGTTTARYRADDATGLTALCAISGSAVPPPSAGFWAAALVAAVGATLLGHGLYWYLLRRIGVAAISAD